MKPKQPVLKTIYPVPGKKVRGPQGDVVPAEGMQVVWGVFWIRSLANNDISLEAPAADQGKTTKAARATKAAANKPE